MDAFDSARGAPPSRRPFSAAAEGCTSTPPIARSGQPTAASRWGRLFAPPSASTLSGASASRKRKAASAVEAKEQLYLDFGQRSFGRAHECAECGLMYTQGEPTDEAAHRRHHRRHLQGVRVRGAAAQRVVCVPAAGGAAIVAMRPSDGADAARKLAEVKELIDAELGSTPELPAGLSAFLYVQEGGQLLGCAVAHPLSRAFRAVPPRADAAPGESGVLCHDGEPVASMCGVSHIWVDRRHRRKGIGHALLDATRAHFATGFELPLDQLAFSQPTGDGRRLAASYAGTERFLVYED